MLRGRNEGKERRKGRGGGETIEPGGARGESGGGVEVEGVKRVSKRRRKKYKSVLSKARDK